MQQRAEHLLMQLPRQLRSVEPLRVHDLQRISCLRPELAIAVLSESEHLATLTSSLATVDFHSDDLRLLRHKRLTLS